MSAWSSGARSRQTVAPIELAYERAASAWISEGPILFPKAYSANTDVSTVLAPHKTGVQFAQGNDGSTNPCAMLGAFPGIWDVGTGTLANPTTTDWDAGDTCEVVLVAEFTGFANASGLMGVALVDAGMPATYVWSTSTAGRRICVGVDSAGLVRVITSDGTTTTNTSTGVTITSGQRVKIKIVFTKGTNVVVTIDGNSPTTVTATLPSRVGYLHLGWNKVNGQSFSANFYGGFWRLTH